MLVRERSSYKFKGRDESHGMRADLVIASPMAADLGHWGIPGLERVK